MAAKRSYVKDHKPAGRRRAKQDEVEVTWDDVGTDTIRSLIAFAEREDGAVRFGRSRDRAVYSVGFYVGEEHFTEWVRSGDDVDLAFEALLIELAEDFAE